jgi:gag-polypeptide of LTR copia-type
LDAVTGADAEVEGNKAARALDMILTSIPESWVPEVRKRGRALDAYQWVRAKFRGGNIGPNIVWMTQLLDATMGPEESLDDYVSRIENLFINLKENQFPIDGTKAVECLINGLHAVFSMVRTHLLLHCPSLGSFEAVRQYLNHLARHLGFDNQVPKTEPLAGEAAAPPNSTSDGGKSAAKLPVNTNAVRHSNPNEELQVTHFLSLQTY